MVIRLGQRRVRGIVYGDLLEIEVALEADGRAWPDEEWMSLFRDYPAFPADLEEPRLEHGKLRFEASESDLHRAWTALAERVDVTNRLYEQMVGPRDRFAQRGEDARRDGIDDRVHSAQLLLNSFE